MTFEMLTGELPFRREHRGRNAFRASGGGSAARRSRCVPSCRRPSTTCSARGLAKDPADRQDSCAAAGRRAPRRAGADGAAGAHAADRDCCIAALVAALLAVATVVLLLRPWAAEPAASPTGSLVLIDPGSGAVAARDAGSRVPVIGGERTRRRLDGRLPGGCPVAVRAGDRCVAADLVARRTPGPGRRR